MSKIDVLMGHIVLCLVSIENQLNKIHSHISYESQLLRLLQEFVPKLCIDCEIPLRNLWHVNQEYYLRVELLGDYFILCIRNVMERELPNTSFLQCLRCI